MIPFWSNDPSVLFDKEYIFDLWPTTEMCYEQKLNSITRLIIIITILGYVFSMSPRILVTGLITVALIFALFKFRKQKLTNTMMKEGFDNEVTVQSKMITNPVTLESVVHTEFKEGSKKNPFSNVLLTDIMDDPDRKPAPPSFNPTIDEDITKNIKKSVQFMNPEIKNTSKQLYGDLWQNFELDQSNRAFFSTANTRVTNDQGAFGEYLYGNMPSSKESNTAGNMQRVADAYRYTLY